MLDRRADHALSGAPRGDSAPAVACLRGHRAGGPALAARAAPGQRCPRGGSWRDRTGDEPRSWIGLFAQATPAERFNRGRLTMLTPCPASCKVSATACRTYPSPPGTRAPSPRRMAPHPREQLAVAVRGIATLFDRHSPSGRSKATAIVRLAISMPRKNMAPPIHAASYVISLVHPSSVPRREGFRDRPICPTPYTDTRSFSLRQAQLQRTTTSPCPIPASRLEVCKCKSHRQIPTFPHPYRSI